LNAEPSRHLAAFSRHSNATSLGSPLRILHVFRAPVGGLFRHVVDVARAQIARGLDVGIFCDSSTGGERAAQALDELRPGLTLGVTRVPMWRNPHPLDAAALYAFNRAYRSLKPNVLHGHGRAAPMLGWRSRPASTAARSAPTRPTAAASTTSPAPSCTAST